MEQIDKYETVFEALVADLHIEITKGPAWGSEDDMDEGKPPLSGDYYSFNERPPYESIQYAAEEAIEYLQDELDYDGYSKTTKTKGERLIRKLTKLIKTAAKEESQK